MRSVVLAVCVLVAACGAPVSRVDGGAGGGLSLGGGFGGFGGSGGGTSGTGGGAAGGSTTTGGGAASCGSTGPIVFRQLHGSFSPYSLGGSAHSGGLDPVSRRLFTLPLSVTPTLQSLITVRLEDEGTTLRDGGSRAFVETVPVSGTLPTGNLTASAFDEQSGVLTGLYFTRAPGYEVVQLQVSDAGARFTTLQQTDTPDANGFLLQTMFGTSSRLGVVGGNDVRPLTISGTQATWGAPVAGQPWSDIATYDRTADRVISIGSFQFTPPMTATWISTVQERSPTAANWTPISMTGTGLVPITPTMAPYPFVVWDAAGQRLLATSTRMELIGTMMLPVPTVVEANLQMRTWRELGRINQSMTTRGPFVVDRAKRQFFETDLANALSMAPGREFERAPVKLTGALPGGALWSVSSAARRPDGVIFLSTGNGLVTFDPSTTTWSRVVASVPTAQGGGSSLAFDPVGSRLLMLFGVSQGTETNVVSSLSADGKTFSPVTTMGMAPAGRTNAGVLIIGNTLIIAGGRAGTQVLSDVHALDLTTMTWRKLGDVTARQNPALVAHEGSVVVVGGYATSSMAVQTIERIELTGSVRMMTVNGTVPTNATTTAPFGRGLIAIDLGGTVDFGRNQLFELSLSGNTATWSNSDPGVMDQALNPLVGVAGGSCDEAFLLGASPFRVSR